MAKEKPNIAVCQEWLDGVIDQRRGDMIRALKYDGMTEGQFEAELAVMVRVKGIVDEVSDRLAAREPMSGFIEELLG